MISSTFCSILANSKRKEKKISKTTPPRATVIDLISLKHHRTLTVSQHLLYASHHQLLWCSNFSFVAYMNATAFTIMEESFLIFPYINQIGTPSFAYWFTVYCVTSRLCTALAGPQNCLCNKNFH